MSPIMNCRDAFGVPHGLAANLFRETKGEKSSE